MNDINETVVGRDRLPKPMVDRSKLSIWNILKQCVDKELYRLTLPIIWNEPLSLLQRMAENTKYANVILEKAASSKDPIERMKLVATYLVSSISMHASRLSKPFNPLLGETYELSRDGYHMCLEQVSHHPPISAYHAESLKKTWKYHGTVHPQMRLNLLNASLEAMPEGVQMIEFPELDEVYTWNNVKVNAHNLLIGKLWFEYSGQTEIVNHKLNIRCVIDFKPYSWYTRLVNRVEGYILDSSLNKIVNLSGQWDQYLYACSDVNYTKFFTETHKMLSDEAVSLINKKKPGLVEPLWKTDLNEGDVFEDYYNFTKFTFSLNELNDELKKVLPSTDCRLRPDIRLLEEGEVDSASEEKHRLEEKQREKQRKVNDGEVEAFEPLWFKKDIVNGDETWVFTDRYWDRDFSKCSDIY
jgi:hypothetical protein